MSIVMRLCLLILCSCVMFANGCSDTTTTTDISASVNSAPTITSVTATPNTVAKGGKSQITVIAVDPEDDDLTYTFDVNGGNLAASGNDATWVAPNQPGKYTVHVSISDGHNTTTAWVALTVFVPLTTLTGSLTLPDGLDGDLSVARVMLKAGGVDTNSDQLIRYATVDGQGSVVSFLFEDVTPGRYFLEAWRDSDHNGRLSEGDYVGEYGTTSVPGNELPPLQLQEGQTRFVQIQMGLFDMVNEEDDTGDGHPDIDNNFKEEGEVVITDVDK